jgi:sulfate transport system substrate-binding protein
MDRWQPARIWQLGMRSLWRWLALIGIGMSLTGAIAACNPGTGKPSTELTLVSFAVTHAAYKEIIPKFTAKWQQEHQQTVTIAQSYGGSGAQARAVIDGLRADVVHLALALDIDRIAKAGLLASDWERTLPNNSIVSRSVAALVTRPGNPKNITQFTDLARPGVTWVTADPKTSGVARWNFMALWHTAMQAGKPEAQAQNFMANAYRQVAVLARDAREATDAFTSQGQGDALINYENEILLARSRGKALEHSIPNVNISIDNPIALVTRNIARHNNREVVEAFVQYLFTPEAQAEFVKAGFRPIEPANAATQIPVPQFPPVETLGTIEDYGGWSKVQKTFFDDGAFFDQMQTKIRS